MTAAKTRGTWFLQAILQRGRPWSGIRRIRRTTNSQCRLLGHTDSFTRDIKGLVPLFQALYRTILRSDHYRLMSVNTCSERFFRLFNSSRHSSRRIRRFSLSCKYRVKLACNWDSTDESVLRKESFFNSHTQTIITFQPFASNFRQTS